MSVVKDLRKQRGMTQGALAEKAGVEPRTISLYETGKVYPHVTTRQKIADALGVGLQDLELPVMKFSANQLINIYETLTKHGLDNEKIEAIMGDLK